METLSFSLTNLNDVSSAIRENPATYYGVEQSADFSFYFPNQMLGGACQFL